MLLLHRLISPHRPAVHAFASEEFEIRCRANFLYHGSHRVGLLGVRAPFFFKPTALATISKRTTAPYAKQQKLVRYPPVISYSDLWLYP